MTTPQSRSHSPPTKRTKIFHEIDQDSAGRGEPLSAEVGVESDADNENNCSICLQLIIDRTVIPKCSHEFCFDCLLVWTEQSRRCPLCSQDIGQYLIHSIRSRYDYRKHYLTPLRKSPPPPRSQAANLDALHVARHRRRREREWGRQNREERESADRLEAAISKRRWIYRHDLYAKHMASNAYTKYRPYPTPAQFSASQDYISRTTMFLRRELQVWENLDVEFLTTIIISLMKSIDIRSESAVKLIAEFLDMDEPYEPGGRHVNAEHFAHEVYSYVRSPYKDLFVYDSIAQYDVPATLSPPPDHQPNHRWRRPVSPPHSPIRESRSRSRSVHRPQRPRLSSPNLSWSPSGRSYPSKHTNEAFVATRTEASGSHRNQTSSKLVSKHSYEDLSPSLASDELQSDTKHKNYSGNRSEHHLQNVTDENARDGILRSTSLVKEPRFMFDASGKGKGRADKNTDNNSVLVKSHEARSEPSHDKEQNDHRDAVRHDEAQLESMRPKHVSTILRLPKERSLRNAVQAHLLGRNGTITRASSNTAENFHGSSRGKANQQIDSQNSLGMNSDSKPSLLARLSGTDPSQIHGSIPDSDAAFHGYGGASAPEYIMKERKFGSGPENQDPPPVIHNSSSHSSHSTSFILKPQRPLPDFNGNGSHDDAAASSVSTTLSFLPAIDSNLNTQVKEKGRTSRPPSLLPNGHQDASNGSVPEMREHPDIDLDPNNSDSSNSMQDGKFHELSSLTTTDQNILHPSLQPNTLHKSANAPGAYSYEHSTAATTSMSLANASGSKGFHKEQNPLPSHVGSPPRPSNSMGAIPIKESSPPNSASISDQSHNHVSGILGSRTSLVARLEEARTQAQRIQVQATADTELAFKSGDTDFPDATTLAVDRNFRASDRQRQSSPLRSLGSSDSVVVNSESLEARLRARAHVRARLAAEKQSSGVAI